VVDSAVKLCFFPITRDSGDHGDSCGPLPASLSQSPTPRRRFVENKSQSAIRPSGDRAVETPFLCFFSLPIWLNFSRFSPFQLSGRQWVATQLLGLFGQLPAAKFSKTFTFHTLGRCHTIALFFAQINSESGHVLRKSMKIRLQLS
jgi:hypothetical protein